MNTRMVVWDSVPSPRGDIIIVASDTGICWTGTPGTSLASAENWLLRTVPGSKLKRGGDNSHLVKAVRDLTAYFEGNPADFSGPFDLWGSPFQVAVWREMAKIPYGRTVTYGQLAASIGKPNAARAIGGACNRNPVAVLIPCHRVVGSNGSLTGYGGGLPTKEWLLAWERSHAVADSTTDGIVPPRAAGRPRGR